MGHVFSFPCMCVYNYDLIVGPCAVTIEYNIITLCTGFPACIVNNWVFHTKQYDCALQVFLCTWMTAELSSPFTDHAQEVCSREGGILQQWMCMGSVDYMALLVLKVNVTV